MQKNDLSKLKQAFFRMNMLFRTLLLPVFVIGESCICNPVFVVGENPVFIVGDKFEFGYLLILSFFKIFILCSQISSGKFL